MSSDCPSCRWRLTMVLAPVVVLLSLLAVDVLEMVTHEVTAFGGVFGALEILGLLAAAASALWVAVAAKLVRAGQVGVRTREKVCPEQVAERRSPDEAYGPAATAGSRVILGRM